MGPLSDYDYELPPELVAQEPLPERDGSRLLVVHRSRGTWEHARFRDVASALRAEDVLVLNETRVFPARLRARRPSGGRVEVFLLRPEEGDAWEVLARPARALEAGAECELEAAPVIVRSLGRSGPNALVKLIERGRALSGPEVMDLCERVGEVPLPPYIRRAEGERRRPEDRLRYQTVYARSTGAVAAPTAGLHFTPELLEEVRRNGVEIVRVTLHVGGGTFKPLTEEAFRATSLHAEEVEVAEEAGGRILEAVRAGRRIVAVGTTSLRAIESFLAAGTVPYRGKTDLFVKPGYAFRGTGALVTNFHLPRSSLVLLVCAFAGRDLVLAAYREAIREGYRFYSYGDAMLIL